MKITLQPTTSTKSSLSGQLLVDGTSFGYFLTLPLGDGLPGSAIPVGKYPVTLGPSAKFQAIANKDAWCKQYMNVIPHIDNIPNRSTILIHTGNSPEQTEGCILVGSTLTTDWISNSKAAFAKLWPLIDAAIKAGEGCELEMLAYHDPKTITASNFEDVQSAANGD